MDTTLITSLSVAVITLAAGVIGAIISVLYKWFENKKIKRAMPTISIWDNDSDNIDGKLKNKKLRWFINLEKIDNLVGAEHYLYFHLQSYEYYKMLDCKVGFTLKYIDENGHESEEDIKPYSVGTLVAQREPVLPLKITDNTTNVTCFICYLTENRESMKYEVLIKIKEMGTSSICREERFYIKKYKEKIKKKRVKGDKYKLIREQNFNLVVSYSSKEVMECLNGHSLNRQKEQ